MWEINYDKNSGREGGGFRLSRILEEDESSKSSVFYIPWSDRTSQTLNSLHDVQEKTMMLDDESDDDFKIVNESYDDGKSDAYSWINVDESHQLPVVNSESVSSKNKDLYVAEPSSLIESKMFEGQANKEIKKKTFEADKMNGGYNFNNLYGNNSSIWMACFVRALLIGHNILTVWSVTDAYNENLYWLLVIGNFFLIFEGMVVVIQKGGVEYSWWSPCFLIYLASTIPAIWLLQLNQYNSFVNVVMENKSSANANGTDESKIDVRVIIIEESVIYLLVFSRWLLPGGKVSRNFLADLLIEFLAVASDIMALLALFDEDKIRGNLHLTYAIMAVWSASFIQFVPVCGQRRNLRKKTSPKVACITKFFGDKFMEMAMTCTSIFFQDLPFLVIRLYIIIKLKVITYSLIFFLIKNIVFVLLLVYKLVVLCWHLPLCQGETK